MYLKVKTVKTRPGYLQKRSTVIVILVCAAALIMTNCTQAPSPDPSTPMIVGSPQTADSIVVMLNVMNENLNKTADRLDSRIKILDGRTAYYDSLYFELREDIRALEVQINQNRQAGARSADGPGQNTIHLTSDEYRAKYIEALAEYQNGNYDSALSIFNSLLKASRVHDYSDNCQYWLGEIYYAKKDYRRAILEFEKVFDFPGANKADHAMFKLGLCHMNIGENQEAKTIFRNHIENYPNSDRYQRSFEYFNSL